MAEIKDVIIEMLREPQLGNLATITLDGKPWTRYVMARSDADFKINIAISLDSRKVEQIGKNSEVHLTFGINNLDKDMAKPYVQIQGKASVSTDHLLKEKVWFPMLENVFDGPGDHKYGVMVIEPYYAEFFNPSTLTPEIWEKQ